MVYRARGDCSQYADGGHNSTGLVKLVWDLAVQDQVGARQSCKVPKSCQLLLMKQECTLANGAIWSTVLCNMVQTMLKANLSVQEKDLYSIPGTT